MKNNSQKTYSDSGAQPVLHLSSQSVGKIVKEFMQKGKTLKLKTKGHSMNPIIKHDDILTISPYTEISPSPGDIVVYINPVTNGLIIHRLLKITDDIFIAKGDNCRQCDSAFKTTCIMGYVSQINKKNSEVNIWLALPLKKILAHLSRTMFLFLLNKVLKRI